MPDVANAFFSQAVADAIGIRFEFCDPSSQELHDCLSSDRELRITDDTQMALFGLEAMTEWRVDSSKPLVDHVKAAYLRWHDTQVGDVRQYTTGLASKKDMHGLEAQGMAYLMALSHVKSYNQPLRNVSDGCGSIIRLLPFALLLERERRQFVQSVSLYSAGLTHGGPETKPAVILFLDVVEAIYQDTLKTKRWQEYRDARLIQTFGDGVKALSCVQMAIWALLHANAYEHLLELAICHKGDSATVAAVAGALWGISGRSGWEHYGAKLAQRDTIAEAAERYQLALDGKLPVVGEAVEAVAAEEAAAAEVKEGA